MAIKGTNSCKKARKERAAKKARKGHVVAADRREALQRMQKADQGRRREVAPSTVYAWG